MSSHNTQPNWALLGGFMACAQVLAHQQCLPKLRLWPDTNFFRVSQDCALDPFITFYFALLILLLISAALRADLRLPLAVWLHNVLRLPCRLYLIISSPDYRLGPGGCWRKLHPCGNQVKPMHQWLSRRQFRDFAWQIYQYHVWEGTLVAPFVRIVTIRPGVHHVLQQSSSLGRLVRFSKLPPGWYGAGNLDPDFYGESGLRNIILSMHMGDYTKSLAIARRSAPYAVPGRMMTYLSQAGIDSPPPHAPAHPHPVHYALRNQSLAKVARLLTGKWYGLFINADRLTYLQTLGCSPPVDTFCPRYEGKDITRYARSPVPTLQFPLNDSPIWFAEDTLHHLSPSTVGSWFDANPTLRYLVCTTVIPPETLFGLSPAWPSLYNFDVHDGLLTYVPENNNGGSYVQPVSGKQWLTASTLISPANACLHVSKLDSCYSHHVILISREQLIPEKTRTLDMPALTVIPWYVHPFGGLEGRLTTPRLVSTLTSYAVRVSATNMRDLYAKVGATQAAQFDAYPDKHVRAACIYALYLRNTDYHHTLRWLDYLVISIARVFRLPLVGFAWAFQSYTSTSFQTAREQVKIWRVRTSPLVSQNSDSSLPGVASAICPGYVSLFQLTPMAGTVEKFANCSARLTVFALSKYLGFGIVTAFNWGLHNAIATTEVLAYLLDFNWRITPLGFLLTLLLYWYGVRGPTIPLPQVIRPLCRRAKWFLAAAFGLPYARLPTHPGHSIWYLFALDYFVLIFAFPKFHPLVLWKDHQTFSTRVLQHTHWHVDVRRSIEDIPTPTGAWDYKTMVLFVRLLHLAIALVLLGISAAWSRRAYAVRHFNGPTCCVHPACPDYVPPVVQDEEGAPNVPPVAPRPVPDLPDAGDDEPQPQAPLAAMGHLPQMVPGDPLRIYNLPPRVIENFADWQNMIWRLQPPPNGLQPEQMCVWEVLSAAFASPPAVLWACFVSTLPVPDRVPFALGGVPRARLTSVLEFFGIAYEMRYSAADPNCPRGPGMVDPEPLYNPNLPPIHNSPGLPGWPHLNLYLQGNDDGTFHLHDRAFPHANAPVRVPDEHAMIGWQSRSVPAIEISEVLNLPAKAFSTAYRRLQGTLLNMFSGQGAPRLGGVVLPAVPVQRQSVQYVPTLADATSAVNLAADLKVHPSALNMHDVNVQELVKTVDQMAKQFKSEVQGITRNPRRQVTFHLYHGAYGTGKTRQLMPDLLAAHNANPFNPSTIAFHTWDHDLRQPLRSAALATFPNVGLQAHNFMTGAMPLAVPRTGTVVFDDAGKCWNGFLQLFIAANPGVTDIYITFDACQAQGSFPNAPSNSRSDISTPAWLSQFSDYYATNVVRTSPAVTDLYGLPHVAVPGRMVGNGQVMVVSKSPAGVPLLAVSPRFTQTQSMGGQVANTFVESQGHTIHGDVCIDLGGLTATATEAAAWTALTRATGNIYLCLGPNMSSNNAIDGCWAKSQILTALLTVASVHRNPVVTTMTDPDNLVKSAVLSHMARSLSPAACARLGLGAPDPIVGTRGVNSVYRQSWLDQNMGPSDIYTARTHRARIGKVGGAMGPAFSSHKAQPKKGSYDVAHAVRHFTEVTNEDVLTSESSAYSLPAPPILEVQPDPIYDINEPTDDVLREIVVESGAATQQHILDGAPDALHHTRADKLTDQLGMEKRIKLGAYTSRWTAADARRLKQLQRGFAKFFDVKAWASDGYNPYLMERSHAYKLQSWASKRTGAAIQTSLDKQDLDAPHHFVKLFPKGQYIKKKAKWRFDAFASQTVSDFHLGRIFHDSPYATYLETKVMQHVLPTTYLHYRATPDDLSVWYKTNWKPGVMTANDYTAWDSGIDHVFLEFDLWLCNLCGFPQDFIDHLRWQRLNTYSFRGVHQPRQESGDRWTWILNTVRNAALTGASLDCPAGTPACFSGDDSVVLGGWRRASNFQASQWLMQPKRDEGTRLEFCGLVFGGDDVTNDPEVVYWRSRFGLQQGRSDPDYWRSIRDAICESSSRLGNDEPLLSSAALNLDRAIDWFGLPPDSLRIERA